MDELEPDEDGDESIDDRLIKDGSNNINIDSMDPLGFEDDAHNEQDWDGEDKLVKKGVDRMDLFRHKPLDIECGGSPEECCRDLKDVPEEHGGAGGLWPSLKYEDHSGKCED